MASTLSYGFEKPATGDKGSIFWPILEDNIQRTNDHTHNGSNSAKISASASTAVVQTVTSAGWSGVGGGLYRQTVTLPALPNADGTQVFFSEPFELAGRRNIRVTGESAVQTTWVYLEGDLINDETGVVQSFPIEISYYQGVDDGESWTEGDQKDSAKTSAMPAGRYVLRLEGQWEKWQQPAVVTVAVQQNVATGFNLLLALIAISIGPIVMLIYHISFEHKRWSESMFSSSGSGDDDDDD